MSGGILAGRLSGNRTGWVCSVVDRLNTGGAAESVVHRADSLWRGDTTPRMTVMAVISGQPIQDFGQSYLDKLW
jgi:hypothetical protein